MSAFNFQSGKILKGRDPGLGPMQPGSAQARPKPGLRKRLLGCLVSGSHSVFQAGQQGITALQYPVQ